MPAELVKTGVATVTRTFPAVVKAVACCQRKGGLRSISAAKLAAVPACFTRRARVTRWLPRCPVNICEVVASCDSESGSRSRSLG